MGVVSPRIGDHWNCPWLFALLGNMVEEIMSRYVLVEFEDDAQAQKFIDKIDFKAIWEAPGYRIAGVYQRPNSWCGCPFQIEGENRPVTRGKKFGWWVCGWCKKPRPGTHQLVNLHPTDTERHWLHTRRYEMPADLLSVFEIPNHRKDKE